MGVPSDEQSFIRTAEERLVEHMQNRRNAGKTDVIFAVVRSTTGNIYDGIPLETSMPQFDCCAERHAINKLRQAEPDAPIIDTVLVAGPVPVNSTTVTTPCGACRHVINEFSNEGTVYCTSFVREPEGWTLFPAIERHTATELYPHRHPDPEWD